MKTSIRLMYLILIIPSVIGIYSCENNYTNGKGKGTIKFSFNLQKETKHAKSAFASDSGTLSYQLMVSVEDLNGNSVLSDEMIPIYTFGEGFVSEKIEIDAGEYMLTKFMVINPSGKVIYAAPVAGSPLAYLINNPLPFSFSIIPDQVTTITPEVIDVGDHTPGEFGYANFGLLIIRPLDLWVTCYLDNPLIMSPVMFTSARLTILAEDGWNYSFDLVPDINHLVIRGGSQFYTFILEKEGYETQIMLYPAGELIGTTQNNPLGLKIPWGYQYQVLELQPGPEEGKDAMISDLQPDMNFGDNQYFEATYLPEPMLTVMRSNRSLLWFDTSQLPDSAIIQRVTLHLTYDLPVPFDSTFSPGEGDNDSLAYGGILQQVITPWSESEVTWNTQPSTTEENQVSIFPFMLNTNSIDVDVTSLYVSSAGIVTPDFGMLFKLYPAGDFPGFRFVSSDYPDAIMRPKLTIYYTTGK